MRGPRRFRNDGFGWVSPTERRQADEFYASLMGWPSTSPVGRPPEDLAEDLPGCPCSLDADGNALVRRLAVSIEAAVMCAQPHDTRPLIRLTGPTQTFNGNWDYHSSVHSHWALLDIFRSTGDNVGRNRILARLSETTLQQEWTFLQSSQMAWDRPYAVAWLAMLLCEIARDTSRNTPALRALRQQVEAWLIHFLQSPPDDTLLGEHRSWLFTLLMLVMSNPITPGIDARIDGVIVTHLIPRHASWSTRPTARGDFLFVPAILQTLQMLRPTLSGSQQVPLLPMMTEPEFATSATWMQLGHDVGLLMTQLWPLAIWARLYPTERLRVKVRAHPRNPADATPTITFCERFREHLRAWLQSPQHWEFGNPSDPSWQARFENNSHWAGSMLWMAIRLSCR